MLADPDPAAVLELMHDRGVRGFVAGDALGDKCVFPPDGLREQTAGDGAADDVLEMAPRHAEIGHPGIEFPVVLVADGQAVILVPEDKTVVQAVDGVAQPQAGGIGDKVPFPHLLGPLRQGALRFRAAAQQIAEIGPRAEQGAIGVQPGQGHADEQGAGGDCSAGKVDVAPAQVFEVAQDPEPYRDQADDDQNREGRDRQHCDSRKLQNDLIRRHCTLPQAIGPRSSGDPAAAMPRGQYRWSWLTERYECCRPCTTGGRDILYNQPVRFGLWRYAPILMKPGDADRKLECGQRGDLRSTRRPCLGGQHGILSARVADVLHFIDGVDQSGETAVDLVQGRRGAFDQDSVLLRH